MNNYPRDIISLCAQGIRGSRQAGPEKEFCSNGEKMTANRLLLGALILLVSTWFPLAATAAPGVILLEEQPYHTGKFNLREMDLWIQAKGLPVRMTRTYTSEQGWEWNRRWANLELKKNSTMLTSSSGQSDGDSQLGDSDPEPASHYAEWDYLQRQDVKFERVSGQSRFGYLGSYIEATEQGYTWKNRQGDWISYNTAGTTLSYGDSEGNAYTLLRDGQGRVTGVKDKLDRTLVTITYAYPEGPQPASVTDYSGRSLSYHYNSDRNLVRVTDVLGYNWVYEYTEGRLVRRIDPENRATTYNWDDGRVDEIVQPDGSSTVYSFGYDRNGGGSDYYRFTIKGEDGTVSEQKIWNADAKRLMIRANYPSATNVETTVSFSSTASDEKEVFSHRVDGDLINRVVYNWKDQVSKITDQTGRETTIEEDQWSNPLKTVHPDGTTETRTFHRQYDYPTRYTNQAGTEFTYGYDSEGRLTSMSEAANAPVARNISFSHTEYSTVATFSGPGGDSFSQSSYFDDRGNLERWIDGEGHETTYTYDVMGNMETLNTPRGTTYTYTYDVAGNLLSEEDPLGRITKYDYDKVGNLVTETAPNQSKTQFGHDALDQWIEVTDHLGQKASHDYAPQTRRLSASSGDTSRVTERYNAFGQPLELVDGEGNSIQYSYENYLLKEAQFPTFRQTYEHNNQELVSAITTEFDGQNSTRRFEYDVLGQLVKTLNDDNHSAQYEYDELGRVTRFTDASSGVTRFYWDHRDNLIRVLDPENREVRLEYDSNGYLTAEIFQSDGVDRRREYTYDGNGNLTQVRSPAGETLAYTYDDADQLIRLDMYPSHELTTPDKVVSFTYNQLGLIEGYDDGDTSASYTYTALGQLASVTTDYGPFSKTIQYQYNEDGVLSSYTNPEGVTYRYTYNKAGRPSAVEIPEVGVIGITDYQWTQPQAITLPGGSRIERTYNSALYMTGNQLLDPARNAVMSVLYGYDNVGNVTSQSTEHGDYSYSYDQLYRLDGAAYPDKQEETFSYDGVGNRTEHASGLNAQEPTSVDLEYNDGNQLARQGTRYYQYDANGNLTSVSPDPDGVNPERRYKYNAEQRLVRVEQGGGNVIARYGYNPVGYRVWKEVDGIKTYYLYNANGLAAEYDASGVLIKEYQYLPNSPWMTNPLFMREGGATYFYQTDHFGRPLRLIKASGETVWEGRYNAFGEAQVVTSTVENNLRLSGQYFDAETGLHHNFMRDYDPALGRYIQADPIGLAGGLNRYAYAGLSPLMAIDPDGLAHVRYKPIYDFDVSPNQVVQGIPFLSQINSSDGTAGFFDGATDWLPGGGNRGIRDQFDIGGVDTCSSAYRFMHTVGQILPVSRGGRLLSSGTKKLNGLAKGRKSGTGTRNATGNPCKCFVAGTLVQTESGPVAVEDIEVGDLVWAKHDVTGDAALKPVLAQHQTEEKPVVEVTLKDEDGNLEVIGTTPEHPFWLSGKSWTRSEKLEPGDLVESRSGLSLEVVSVEHQEQMQPTFNFEVADYHTYFVGTDGVWVHNACKDPGDSRANSRAKRRAAREAQRQHGTPTSKPGKNHQDWEPGSPRHQTKEGADGALDGIVDGSRDTVPGHGPHVEVGKVKANEPFNKHNQPRLRPGKSKVEY